VAAVQRVRGEVRIVVREDRFLEARGLVAEVAAARRGPIGLARARRAAGHQELPLVIVVVAAAAGQLERLVANERRPRAHALGAVATGARRPSVRADQGESTVPGVV